MTDGTFINKKNWVILYVAFADLIADQSPMPLEKFRRMQRKLAREIWDKCSETERLNLFVNYTNVYVNELRKGN